MDCHAWIAFGRGQAGSRRPLAVRSAVGIVLLLGSVIVRAQTAPGGPFAAYESLPDSPGHVDAPQATAQESNASISGVVLDINEGFVPEATVTLREPGQPDRTVTSGQDGRFSFTGLPAGKYRVFIRAPGLEGFESPEILLHTAERHELQKLALPIAKNSVDVQVTVTEVEIAQEQIKAQEQQRVFGVIPNFYTSYIWNAAPLTSKQKFDLAFHSIFDPVDFLGTAVAAGIQQKFDVYHDYGGGIEGYAKRYGASYADGAIARMLGSAVLPSILHQDPRYFYQGTGTKKSRILHALSSAIICRGDNGRPQPAYSRIGGSFAGGAISNAYHPAASRGVRLTIDNGLIDIGGNAVTNVLREFLLKDLTPKVPVYATGKPTP